jgi:hypothetical protein
MHLDIFGSHMECHIPSPNYISKFFNTHTHTHTHTHTRESKLLFYLILQALLGVLCNKFNTYGKDLPITESGWTVLHRLDLNLLCGSTVLLYNTQ